MSLGLKSNTAYIYRILVNWSLAKVKEIGCIDGLESIAITSSFFVLLFADSIVFDCPDVWCFALLF